MANELNVRINNVKDLDSSVASIYRIVYFLKISKGYRVVDAQKKTEVIAIRIDDSYYSRNEVFGFVQNSNAQIVAKLSEKQNLADEKSILDAILDCIYEIRQKENEFDENKTTLDQGKREELLSTYELELKKEAENAEKYAENKGQLKTYGNLTLEEQVDLIAKFQAEKIITLEDGVFESLKDKNSNVDWQNNEKLLRNSIHNEIEKLVAIRGNIIANGGEFSQKDFQSFYYDIESQLLTTGAISQLLKGVDEISQDPRLGKYYESKTQITSQTSNFGEIVRLYKEKYGMSQEAALKAATYCEKALASGENAESAHIKGFISVGYSPSRAVDLIKDKEVNDQSFEESMKLLSDHKNFDAAGIIVKDGKIKVGNLLINSARIGDKNISIEQIHIKVNQALTSQGKSPIGINELQRLVFNNFDGLTPERAEYLSQTQSELRQSYNNTQYRDLFSENRIELANASKYLENRNFDYQTETRKPSALASGVKRLAGGIVRKGAGKVVGKLAVKAGLTATGIGAPIAGLLAAKDLAEKIPGVGKAVKKGQELAKDVAGLATGSPGAILNFVKKHWKPIAAGVGVLSLGLFKLLSGLAKTAWHFGGAFGGGVIGYGVGFSVGGPIGGAAGAGIGSVTGSYVGGQIGSAVAGQGGLVGLAGNGVGAVQGMISGLPATLSTSIYASVPTIALGTVMAVSIFNDIQIRTAFSLAPIDDTSYSYVSNLNLSCEDENGNEIKIPNTFAKGWPVGIGTVTSGVGTINRHSSGKVASRHNNAIDISLPIGKEVRATHDGKVFRVEKEDTGYGWLVVIEGEVDGNKFETWYAHLSAINVRVGNEVEAGKTIIGSSGNSGNSTGPHIHYEIKTKDSDLSHISIACTLPLDKDEKERLNNKCRQNCSDKAKSNNDCNDSCNINL